MAPLDWGRIMGADIEVLRKDPDAADDMYGLLEMVRKLQHAFGFPSYLLFGFWIQKPFG